MGKSSALMQSAESDHVRARRRSPRLEAILSQLEEIVLSEGFLHLRVDNLARRLRCSNRSLYELAKSREELFDRVIERYVGTVRADGWRAVETASNPFEAVMRYIGAALPAARRASPQFLNDLLSFPSGQRILQQHQLERARGLEGLIEKGVKEHAFRPVHPRLIAEVVLAIASKLLQRDLLVTIGITTSDAIQQITELLAVGLAPPSASERRRLQSTLRKSRRRPRPEHSSNAGTIVL